ncbi:MAG: sulfatase [Phycisphaerae bacterium]|nr:sulfatase [Phycisphaerae bacterium]
MRTILIVSLTSFVLATAAATGAERTAAQPSTAKPNIVFILADDLGYTDVGCCGSKYYDTPNIDRLAAGGIRFSSGYTCAANCQPTRATLISGQYGPRTGTYTVGGIDRFNWRSRPLRPVDNVSNLPLDKITLAQALKAAGYATAMFGKWHLGDGGPYHPSQRGFDEAIVSAGQHFNFKTEPQVEYPDGTYLADFLTDKATDFIRRHKDKPFFLYLPHFGVHSPWQAKDEWIVKFKPKAPAGGHNDPVYAAMIASVDESVGRILALLGELRLTENTLIIFSSDNGGVGGYAREGLTHARDVTDNAPLRGGKGMFYEGGIRVPYIFHWPGRIPPGTTCDQPINSVDLYPTLLAVVGAKPPTDYVLDGVSYLDALASGGKVTLNREALYWHFPGYLGSGPDQWRTLPVGVIRAGDFKLMEFFEDGRLELYNLREDLGEKKNLAAVMPAKAKELQAKLQAWRKQIGAPMPTPNTPGDAQAKETSKQEKKAAKRRDRE